MYVEYYVECEGITCIGSSNRWQPRHIGTQPSAYHIGCTGCGNVYAHLVPLGITNPRHNFLHGTCTSCFSAGRRSLLGTFTLPGSALPCVESHNEAAFLDIFSLELLTHEFNIRYDLYVRTGSLGSRAA